MVTPKGDSIHGVKTPYRVFRQSGIFIPQRKKQLPAEMKD